MNPPPGPTVTGLPHDDREAREEQLDEIVADYIERRQAGEEPDLAELLLLHLSVAQEAAQRIDAAELVHQLAEESRRSVRDTACDAAPGHAESTALSTLGPLDANHSSPRSESTPLPRSLGRYQIKGILGRGASAVVYRAYDPLLKRAVALKVLGGDRLSTDAAARVFTRDAQAVARLRHSNIVPLHEVGEHDGLFYLDMELIEGETLQTRLRRTGETPLPFPETAEMVHKIALALEHAHRAGVIHRDVKPANILLQQRDGEPHLTDFGLAHWADPTRSVHPGESIVGTPAYMSPEQAGGSSDRADARSDVYSLGVVLYRLLTGRLPFEADTPLACLGQIVHAVPPAPRTLNPAIPADLELICLKALEKDPADRFASAKAMAEALWCWLNDLPIPIRKQTLWERVRRFARKHRMLARTVAAATALLLIVGTVLGRGWWTEREQKHQAELAAQNADKETAVAEARAIVEAKSKAEAKILGLQERAWQRLQIPTHGCREQAQGILRQTGPFRNQLDAEILQRLDRETRSFYASTLAIPTAEVVDRGKVPGSGFLVWPPAIHPDGKSLVLGLMPQPVRWVQGQPLKLPDGVTKDTPRHPVFYSPNGKHLVMIPNTGGLKVWDEEATRLTAELDTGKSRVVSVGFDQTTGQMGACLENGEVRCWSVPDFKPAGTWVKDESQRPPIWAAAFNADLTAVVVGNGKGEVWLLRPRGQPQLLCKGTAPVTALTLSADERSVGVGTLTGGVYLYRRRETGAEEVHRWSAGSSEVRSILFHPHGNWLLACTRNGDTVMWDVATGEQVLTINSMVWGFARDGRRFAGGGTSVLFGDLLVPDVLQTFTGHRAAFWKIVWGRDGKNLVTLDTNFEARVWDVVSGKQRNKFNVPLGNLYENVGIALSDDGRLLACANGGQWAGIWEVDTGKLREQWEIEPGFNRLVSIPGTDRFRLVSEEPIMEGKKPTSRLGTVVREFGLGQQPREVRILRTNKAEEQMFFYSELTPDGRFYLWVGPRVPRQNYRVEVWNVDAGNLVTRVPVPSTKDLDSLKAIVSADGRTLWTSADENDPEGGTYRHDLTGKQKRETVATALEGSPDSRWYVTRLDDRLARESHRMGLTRFADNHVWLNFGNRDYSLPQAMTFSGDGRYLAWGSRTGVVTVADLKKLEAAVDAFEKSLPAK